MSKTRATKKAPGPRVPPAASVLLAAFDAMLPAASWWAWRVFVKALLALPLDDRELALFHACTGRSTAPTGRANRVVGLVGRRGGKSRVIAWLSTALAAFVDYSGVLAPGETGVVAIMAPSKVQAGIIAQYVSAFFGSTPVLEAMVERRTTTEIDIRGQGGTLIRVMVVAANFRLSRGHTLVAFVGDESAFWDTETNAASPDTEIFRAILPALATTSGVAVLISTPYAPTGLVYDLHEKYWGVDGDTLVWRAASEVMNPLLDAKLIAQAYRDDPESAAAEWGASFRSDLRTLFAPDVLQSCVVPGRRELPPQPGIVYSRFCDPSGGSSDSFTLAISHKDPTGLLVLDAIREWKSPFDPSRVVAECVATLKKYPGPALVGDRYAAEWVVSAFKAHGITYEAATLNKSELFLEVLPLLNSGSAQLLDDARALGQFAGLQRRTGRSGKDAVDHRTGQRDDVANAIAGALVHASTASGRLALPADFVACNRLLSGLPALAGGNGCYLFSGVGRPPADIICTNCAGQRFVTAARRAHEQRTGEGVDLLEFFETFVQQNEGIAWRALARSLADQWGL